VRIVTAKSALFLYPQHDVCVNILLGSNILRSLTSPVLLG